MIHETSIRFHSQNYHWIYLNVKYLGSMWLSIVDVVWYFSSNSRKWSCAHLLPSWSCSLNAFKSWNINILRISSNCWHLIRKNPSWLTIAETYLYLQSPLFAYPTNNTIIMCLAFRKARSTQCNEKKESFHLDALFQRWFFHFNSISSSSGVCTLYK